MPKDIRSYFVNISASKPAANASTAKPKKRRVISSDEEDEVPQSPVKRSKIMKEGKSSGSSASNNKNVKQETVVSPSSVFSNKPIKRREAPKINRAKDLCLQEALTHNDEIFEATLNQLDVSDFISPPSNNKNHEPRKRKTSSAGSDGGAVVIKEDEKKIVITQTKTTPKKQTVEVQDPYEERAQKKKQHAVAYQQYLQRGGARNPGSKEIPVGANLCLAGLSFVITGVLDSLEREEVEELITKYGGRVLHQVTKKTSYVVVGDQAGPSKIEKAKSFNLKQISEDDLLELIRTLPAGKVEHVKQSTAKSKSKNTQQLETQDDSLSPAKKPKVIVKEETNESAENTLMLKEKAVNDTIVKNELSKPLKEPSAVKQEVIKRECPDVTEMNGNAEVETLVEKYRPKTFKQILGQQGDKSNARKLYNWLNNWQKNQSGQVKHAKPSPWAKNDDGAFFKAALLSGPPGIGKTTTAQVVCKELGFDLVEFNASDTRSKRLLKEEVSELLSNTTLKDYFSVDSRKPSSKHVLLMDEVDGMAGNEDRGGLQELIALIKSSDIPIVCICNDRNHPKMRTLSNYTFDLRFSKPRLEQIRGAMRSICFKEHITISTEDLDRLIESTNHDIRQVINHLALHTDNTCKSEKNEMKHANKDLRLGPWDVVKKVFSFEDQKRMTIHEKSDLFFHDHNIASLFVQDNYLLVQCHAPKEQVLQRVADSAESLAWGDVVEKSIRSNNAWSLLPTQACFSSVIPGTLMAGHFSSQINFPAWLGRNSKANKFDRLLQEITVHARLTTRASKEAINLDYLYPLRDNITKPLVADGNEGVDAAINVMNTYHLLREDLDAIIEVSLWPGQQDPLQNVDSRVKAAFTRAYNKQCTAVPYIMSTGSSKKNIQSSQETVAFGDEEVDANSDADEDNVETDKMIKAKKTSASKKTEVKGKATTKAPTKRGRGRGKGK